MAQNWNVRLSDPSTLLLHLRMAPEHLQSLRYDGPDRTACMQRQRHLQWLTQSVVTWIDPGLAMASEGLTGDLNPSAELGLYGLSGVVTLPVAMP